MEAKSFARQGAHCNEMPLKFPYDEWQFDIIPVSRLLGMLILKSFACAMRKKASQA